VTLVNLGRDFVVRRTTGRPRNHVSALRAGGHRASDDASASFAARRDSDHVRRYRYAVALSRPLNGS